jgi:hypothetical protein
VEGSRERAEAREGGGARLHARLGVRAPAEEVKRNEREWGREGKVTLAFRTGRRYSTETAVFDRLNSVPFFTF